MIPQFFEDLSRKIWTDLYTADLLGTLFSEETVSDILMLEIAKKRFFNIRVLQTPKPLEAVQGTDWEWFVGSNRYGWIRYVMQAKRLNLTTFRYDSLNHKVGVSPNDEYQSVLLRTFSDANGAVPLYCFYNYYPKATELDHWNCTENFEQELLGWTFTPLSIVEEVLTKRGYRTFDKIHQYKETLPIRCLFKHFESIYKDVSTLTQTGDFLGESFKKLQRLPNQLLAARDLAILNEFPEEIYSPKIKIYPKRIAIIDLSENF